MSDFFPFFFNAIFRCAKLSHLCSATLSFKIPHTFQNGQTSGNFGHWTWWSSLLSKLRERASSRYFLASRLEQGIHHNWTHCSLYKMHRTFKNALYTGVYSNDLKYYIIWTKDSVEIYRSFSICLSKLFGHSSIDLKTYGCIIHTNICSFK